MLYGHRNDIDGYAKALNYFDNQLPRIIEKLKKDDVLMITADHGCDPGTESTDHSREYIPLLVYGDNVKAGVNLGTRKTFADIASSVLPIFELKDELDGESLDKVLVTGKNRRELLMKVIIQRKQGFYN